MEKKITKTEYFAEIRAIVEASDAANKEQLIEFVDTQVAQIAAKAEKAKARAAEKRATGDELKAAIAQVLTDEYQNLDTIAAQIDGEDVTRAKISARVSALVREGVAEKAPIKTDGKTAMSYRLVQVAAED